MSAPYGQVPDLTSLIENRLMQITSWPPGQHAVFADVASRLALRLSQQEVAMLGISGAPGTGKSTLAGILALGLQSLGIRSLVVSLDDFYLSRAQRDKLSAIHPLLSQRGVPGTHDWAGLMKLLDKVAAGDPGGIQIPRFDKSVDDIAYDSQFVRMEEYPDILILEGWVVGAPPQDQDQVQVPVNELERESDPDGEWRQWVNAQLGRYYEDTKSRLDEIWFLAAPDWASVVRWRSEQETETASRLGRVHLEGIDAVMHFLDQFQRIATHMIQTSHSWADLEIRLDPNHCMAFD